jgi:Ni/Co efflux regulator RcnB
MKRILLSAAALALAGAFSIGTQASAQPYDYYHHDNGYHRGYYDRGYYRHGDYRPVRYQGWRDRSDWRRGGYVGYADWNRGYQVDYYRYHLQRPPYGYEWRRVGDNYVLAAIATGLIADIINDGY